MHVLNYQLGKQKLPADVPAESESVGNFIWLMTSTAKSSVIPAVYFPQEKREFLVVGLLSILYPFFAFGIFFW